MTKAQAVHHPSHLRVAAHAIGYGRRRQSLAETLAGDRARRPLSSQHTDIVGGPGSTATTLQFQLLTVLKCSKRTRRR